MGRQGPEFTGPSWDPRSLTGTAPVVFSPCFRWNTFRSPNCSWPGGSELVTRTGLLPVRAPPSQPGEAGDSRHSRSADGGPRGWGTWRRTPRGRLERAHRGRGSRQRCLLPAPQWAGPRDYEAVCRADALVPYQSIGLDQQHGTPAPTPGVGASCLYAHHGRCLGGENPQVTRSQALRYDLAPRCAVIRMPACYAAFRTSGKSRRGMQTWNKVPPSARLDALTVPPCASTMPRVIPSPRPNPRELNASSDEDW